MSIKRIYRLTNSLLNKTTNHKPLTNTSQKNDKLKCKYRKFTALLTNKLMIKKEMNPKTKKIVNTTIGLFFATSILFLILLLNSNISKDLVRVLFFMY